MNSTVCHCIVSCPWITYLHCTIHNKTVAWNLHNSLTILTFIIALNFILTKVGNLHVLGGTCSQFPALTEKQTANCSQPLQSPELRAGKQISSEPDSEELRDSLVIVIGKVSLISQPHLQDITTTICCAVNPDFIPTLSLRSLNLISGTCTIKKALPAED